MICHVFMRKIQLILTFDGEIMSDTVKIIFLRILMSQIIYMVNRNSVIRVYYA